MPRLKTNEEFLSDMMECHPEIEVLGVYAGSKVGVDCRCRTCGFEWNPRPNDLLSGHGCPRCGGSHYKTHEEYVAELTQKFPNLEVTSRYRGDGNRIRVRCKTCGYERYGIANSLLRQREGGPNCPGCSGRKRLTQEEFEGRLVDINPSIRVIGKFRGSNTKVKVECLRCGHIWSVTPASLIHSKSGCPSCYHGSTSVMEQFLYWALVHALGEDAVLSRDRSLGVELDVYVPDLELAIEPGSWYWHKHKLAEDEAKRVVCRESGVRLVVIYDQCPIDDPPFETDCLIYRHPLASERDMVGLKTIIANLLGEYGVECDFDEKDWQKIEGKARRSSRRMTTDEFKTKLAEVSPSIEVLSDYVGTGSRVHCRCMDCGYEWSTAAGNLIYQGTKCPYCTHRRKSIDQIPTSMGAEEFQKMLFETSPEIDLLDEYDSLTSRIRVQCFMCGFEWVAMPRVLLSGSGCPRCVDVNKSIEELSQSPEFLERDRERLVESLAAKTRSITIVGEFRGMSRLVTAKCEACGHEWRTRPTKLLRSHMCPSCKEGGNRRGLKTEEQFLNEAVEKNPGLEILGKYRGSLQPIEVRCKRCGRRWESTPARILQGFGCGPCNMRGPRKSTEQYREKLAAVNDRVLLKSEYRGAAKKVHVECLVCGHEWETAAAHLLSGTGCPECAKARKAAMTRKSHEQFVREVAAMSPTVEVLGTYEGKSSRIECRCKKCGHKWTTSGQSLSQGSACPSCAARMIAATQKGIPVSRRTRPVRCVETGEEYRSATAAAHAMGLTDSCVGSAIKRGGIAAGYHWEYVDVESS